MEKKNEPGQAAAFLGKAKDKIVGVADRNEDGALDMKDVLALAAEVGDAAKNAAAAAMDGAAAKKRASDLRTLKPIFEEDLDDAAFLMPKLIILTEKDKPHAESEVCRDSVGHYVTHRGLKTLNIYRDKAAVFGLSFYPDDDGDAYYVDPSDRNRYISLDDYFSYLKDMRVNELQKLAQELGARHFKVTYVERKKSFTKKAVKAKANVKYNGVKVAAEGEHELDATEVSHMEKAAEADFPGHAPAEPTLKYLQKDPDILSLVALRMDKASPLSHMKYTLSLGKSSGIREKDAVKIDAALASMKLTGNASFTGEVKNEELRFLQYEIDF